MADVHWAAVHGLGSRAGALTLAATLLGVALVSGAASAGAQDDAGDLPERHRHFLEEVTLLITDAEREVFVGLGQDHQRDRFISRFWQVRDPFPQTERNEFRDTWELNAELARARFGDLSDYRAQMILFFGEESRTFRTTCSQVLRPLEIWYFDAIAGVRPEFYIVFERGRDVDLWDPRGGLTSLRSGFVGMLDDTQLAGMIAEECARGGEILTALRATANWEEIRDSLPLRPRLAQEWIDGFVAKSTDVPEGAAALPARHRIDYPGAHQSRTVVQLLLSVPRGEAAVGKIGSYESHNLLVDGEVLRRGELFETFRYKFDVPLAEEVSEPIPLAVERFLRPGTYTLIAKLHDLNGDRYYRLSEEIEVPNLRYELAAETTTAVLDEAPAPDGELELWSEANASRESANEAGDHVVKVWAPVDRLLTGTVRVEAEATGEGISRVAFDLDGREVLTKARPPYSVEINLGRAPRVRRLQARAVGPEGKTLARDEILLNSGPHRFGVRLIEPQRGSRYTASVRANAEVQVPEGDALDRVEMFLNETLVATLYQPPFVQPIQLPGLDQIAYVRATAYLDSGAAAEDLVFVNAPDILEELAVDFVELYTTVLDRRGRPVRGL
ncbi:MAG: GWxTD domain-containing protein, partial [Thermoanaerobaculia bacterium]|nr:GWxTD domain-containing protein [Thermoanaerobaculia bacterium]